MSKSLIELTPVGRGQVVTHNLYKDRELVELRARFAGYVPPEAPADDEPARQAHPAASATAFVVPTSSPGANAFRGGASVTKDEFSELSVEVSELRAEVSRLRDQVSKLEGRLDSVLS